MHLLSGIIFPNSDLTHHFLLNGPDILGDKMPKVPQGGKKGNAAKGTNGAMEMVHHDFKTIEYRAMRKRLWLRIGHNRNNRLNQPTKEEAPMEVSNCCSQVKK